MKFIYSENIPQELLKEAERLSGLIKSFHVLRINGMINKKECKNCFLRIIKCFNKAGLTFNDIGFYEFIIELK